MSTAAVALVKPADPCVDHIYRSPYHLSVYEPCDDTWAMMDALRQEQPWLLERIKAYAEQAYSNNNASESIDSSEYPVIVPTYIEVGIGSGTLLAYLHALLSPYHRTHHTRGSYIGIDKNPVACACARETFAVNAVAADVIEGDLLTALSAQRLSHSVHVMLFNPPYVFTEDTAASLLSSNNDSIDASYAGGLDGRVVTDQLLPRVAAALSAIGCLYMVVLPYNKPDEIAVFMATQGLQSLCVFERRVKNEFLQIWRYWKL